MSGVVPEISVRECKIKYALIFIFLPSVLFAETSFSSGYLQDTGLIFSVSAGTYSTNVKEIVENVPDTSAAEDLSVLSWDGGLAVVGLNVSWQPLETVRFGGGFDYQVHSSAGYLDNQDFTDPSSPDLTHRSVSNSFFSGYEWNVYADYIFRDPSAGNRRYPDALIFFIRAGYTGYLHKWEARGGVYHYPSMSGKWDADLPVIRYKTLHHIPYIGFYSTGIFSRGYYVRIGGDFSYFPFINGEDNHLLKKTDYFDSYRLGLFSRFHFAMGFSTSANHAVEIFHTTLFQFKLHNNSTVIAVSSGNSLPAETPNYSEFTMTFGVRFLWRKL